MDVRGGCRLWIWEDESKPLKTNATGGCLAYHTKNTKRTTMYGMRSISFRQTSGYLLSTSKHCNLRNLSWFGHVCRHDTQPKNLLLQRTVDGSRLRGRPRKSWRDNIKEWTRHCRHCCTMQMTEVDRRPSQHRHIGVPQRPLRVMGISSVNLITNDICRSFSYPRTASKNNAEYKHWC